MSLHAIWRGLWSAESAFYAAMSFLCLVALRVQMIWRIPGDLTVRWLPALGVLLAVVSIVVFVGAVLRQSRPANNRVVGGWGWLEALGKGCIFLYLAFAAFVAANGALDRAPPREMATRIESIARSEIFLDGFVPYAWAQMKSWRDPGRSTSVYLTPAELSSRWGGEPVRVAVHAGLFSVPWISTIARDEEALNRAVLERLPNASQAWRRLMDFYVQREQWQQAEESARAYVAAYSGGYRDVLAVGNRLFIAHEYARSLPFTRIAFDAHKDYETHNLLGWSLGKVGRHEEAIAQLRAALLLDDAPYWAYYHLGYVYLAAGRRSEAAEMFRQVLQRRPDFPEIQRQIAALSRR